MEKSILKKQGANFFGYEHIDSNGKHHFHPFGNKGNGELILTQSAVYFKQVITGKEYAVPVKNITKVDIKPWHNMKMKWPAKVLRIHFREQSDTKILGIAPGGRFNIPKGWQDDAYHWKEEIESLIKGKI